MRGWYSPYTRLVRSFIAAGRLQRTVMERHLNKTGVYRSQHQILMYIAENPMASQKEIAQLYRVSTATIAVSLKKLEQGGYINRVVDRSDNRCNQIFITEKGKDVVEKSAGYFRQLEFLMFQDFTEEELECFQRSLDRIRYNLCSLLPESERKIWGGEIPRDLRMEGEESESEESENEKPESEESGSEESENKKLGNEKLESKNQKTKNQKAKK